MNLNKMRRNLARSTPDVVERTFDPIKDDATTLMFQWRDEWCAMMKLKHGKKFKGYTAYNDSDIRPYGVSIRLEARVER